MPLERNRLGCLEVIRFLREERERRSLSKYALSDLSGVSQPMIGYIERDLRNPTLEILLKIANALEVDLGAVIQRAEKNIPKRSRK